MLGRARDSTIFFYLENHGTWCTPGRGVDEAEVLGEKAARNFSRHSDSPLHFTLTFNGSQVVSNGEWTRETGYEGELTQL